MARAILPYLAVVIGLFWFQNAWVALLSFHGAIVLSCLIARSHIPVRILFQSKDIRWRIVSLLLGSSSGISLYFGWSHFGITGDLTAQVSSLGLGPSAWIVFIAYFTLVNPFLEEYFWRGCLGSPTQGLHISDLAYAGFHALILWGRVQTSSVIYSLTILVLAGWFWRQLGRADEGLLASVFGHMAADFTILMTIYRMSF